MTKTIKTKVRNWNWKSYGDSFTQPIIALAELISNAVDAALQADGERKIKISASPVNLSIENSGKPFMDFGEALNYGYVSKEEYESSKNFKGMNNQHGTGIKNSLSFFSPKNNGVFKIYTKNNESTYSYICGPYSNQMDTVVCDDAEWPFESWSSSRIETKITRDFSEDDVSTLIEDTQRFFTPLFLLNEEHKLNFSIEFNGKLLHAICPTEFNGSSASVSINGQGVGEIAQNIKKWEKRLQAKIDVFEYSFDKENTTKQGFYQNNPSHQGVYLFIGYRFIAYLGVNKLWRKGKNGKNVQLKHIQV